MDIFFDNEFRSLIPPLQTDEHAQLERSLKAEGNRVPITIWKETKLLLDGHNRYDICIEAGVPLKPAEELSLPDRNAAMVWIIQNQFGRRNLNNYQRSVLALRLEEILRPKAREQQLSGLKQYQDTVLEISPKRIEPPVPINTRLEFAKTARVSDNTIAKVKIIEAKATPEQKAKLVNGDATINQVFVSLRRNEVKERVKNTEFPTGKYRVIYADPPWQYGNTQPEYHTVQDDHYPTMPLSEICKLPVSDLALDDAVLFLWVTSPILEESFDVIRAWEFNYKASFVWDKVKHNMGHYNSVRHEFLLIATRGSCQPDECKLFDSVQSIERNGHSEKPELFREIINTLYPYGPRIELFARKNTEGWEVFGNDIH
jgi:N6-adenosine-specific RNA methylase IME4